jgi:hypothetical protein
MTQRVFTVIACLAVRVAIGAVLALAWRNATMLVR